MRMRLGFLQEKSHIGILTTRIAAKIRVMCVNITANNDEMFASHFADFCVSVFMFFLGILSFLGKQAEHWFLHTTTSASMLTMYWS